MSSEESLCVYVVGITYIYFAGVLEGAVYSRGDESILRRRTCRSTFLGLLFSLFVFYFYSSSAQRPLFMLFPRRHKLAAEFEQLFDPAPRKDAYLLHTAREI